MKKLCSSIITASIVTPIKPRLQELAVSKRHEEVYIRLDGHG